MSKESVQEFFQQFKRDAGKMQQAAPEMIEGFRGLFGKVMKEGALSVKTKELIAMSIGLALQCEPCLYLHVQKCVDAGASREEILEAAGVAVMMQGGPSYTHFPCVLDALEALGK